MTEVVGLSSGGAATDRDKTLGPPIHTYLVLSKRATAALTVTVIILLGGSGSTVIGDGPMSEAVGRMATSRVIRTVVHRITFGGYCNAEASLRAIKLFMPSNH